jgi:hypothetical protein
VLGEGDNNGDKNKGIWRGKSPPGFATPSVRTADIPATEERMSSALLIEESSLHDRIKNGYKALEIRY